MPMDMVDFIVMEKVANEQSGVEERRQWRKAAHLAHITEGGQAFMNIGKCYGAKVMPIIIVVVVGSD